MEHIICKTMIAVRRMLFVLFLKKLSKQYPIFLISV